MFRPATLKRIAGALGDLTHHDPDSIYRNLMAATGRSVSGDQVDLGIRGSAELVRQYGRMNELGRHLLLEHARLLVSELPCDECRDS